MRNAVVFLGAILAFALGVVTGGISVWGYLPHHTLLLVVLTGLLWNRECSFGVSLLLGLLSWWLLGTSYWLTLFYVWVGLFCVMEVQRCCYCNPKTAAGVIFFTSVLYELLFYQIIWGSVVYTTLFGTMIFIFLRQIKGGRIYEK